MRDPYEVLRVPRSATADDIKRSFRRLAKALHPDGNMNDPQAPARFAELSSAHEILRDEDKRGAFDRGEIDAEGKPAHQPAAHATRRRRFTSNLGRIVTCLTIVVLMPIATFPLIIRSLTSQAQISPNVDGNNRVLSGFRDLSNEPHADKGQTEQPDRGVQSEPHLILQQVACRIGDDTIPLGAQVINGAVGLVVEINGLPTGMTISSGRALGAGRWRILATDVDNAVIRPPQGFSGTIDLAVELRLADDVIVDHGWLHCERLQKPAVPAAPIDSPGNLAITDNSAGTIMPTRVSPDQNAIHHAADSLDHEQMELLIRRGLKLASEGDVGAARVLLQRAAEAGDVRAELALSATYDPMMLAILQAHGAAADVSLAPDWNSKARTFGSQEAQSRLKLSSVALEDPKRRVVRSPIHRPWGPAWGYYRAWGPGWCYYHPYRCGRWW